MGNLGKSGQPIAAINEVNSTKALELRTEGKTYRQIGEELNVSYQTAFNWVKSELARCAEHRGQMGDKIIDQDLETLQKMLDHLWDGIKAGNPKAVQAGIAVMTRRAKLLGLDTPETKIIEGKVTLEQLVAESYSFEDKSDSFGRN